MYIVKEKKLAKHKQHAGDKTVCAHTSHLLNDNTQRYLSNYNVWKYLKEH